MAQYKLPTVPAGRKDRIVADVPMTPAEELAAVQVVSKALTSALHTVMQVVIDSRPPDMDTPDKQYSRICKRAFDDAKSKVK